MVGMFKRWVAKVARESMHQPVEMLATSRMQEMFQSNMPAVMAFKIDNGYVVRVVSPDAMLNGERLPGFTYCADHQAIADHLVASAAKATLGVPRPGVGLTGYAYAEQTKRNII